MGATTTWVLIFWLSGAPGAQAWVLNGFKDKQTCDQAKQGVLGVVEARRGGGRAVPLPVCEPSERLHGG